LLGNLFLRCATAQDFFFPFFWELVFRKTLHKCACLEIVV